MESKKRVFEEIRYFTNYATFVDELIDNNEIEINLKSSLAVLGQTSDKPSELVIEDGFPFHSVQLIRKKELENFMEIYASENFDWWKGDGIYYNMQDVFKVGNCGITVFAKGVYK